MVVIFKQVSKKNLVVVAIRELVFNFDEILLRMKNEFLESGLQILQVDVVLKGELNHTTWVVDLFVLVEYVETLQILTLFVAYYCFSCFVMVFSSAKSHSLSVTAFTLNQNLGLAREILT